MPRRIPALIALLLSLTLVAAACGDDSGSTDPEPDTDATDTTLPDEGDDTDATDTTLPDEGDDTADDTAGAGTIVDVAVASGDFPTLIAALQAAGLDSVLAGEGPFTVFAPTEQAFADALAALGVTAEELLADPGLSDILTYHVLEGEVLAATVVTLDGEEVPTVNGATVLITIDGENVLVNEAQVTQTDIQADNGVIHVIDAVLLPPSE